MTTNYGLTIIAGAVVTGTVVIVATAGVDAGSNTGVVVVVETTVQVLTRLLSRLSLFVPSLGWWY